ncbi:unnamed protein product [Phytophthora lilii]|uniref:Unnamed protein product n=1 Tax=Phytophthora lilii TaxID=2077276 RepID=A0A9W6U300_9STRA|nr:unnamed protein product [Phytophthora lilii]
MTRRRKDFTPGDGEAQHGVLSGVDEDMKPKLSDVDNDAKTILNDYYPQLHSKRIKIPFRLTPVVETKHGIKNHSTHYFGKPTDSKPLDFMAVDKYNKHKEVSGEARKGLMRTIRWMDTFSLLLNGIEDIDRSEEYDHDDNLQKLHDDSEAAFQAFGKAQKRYEEAKTAVKGLNSKAARCGDISNESDKGSLFSEVKKYNHDSKGKRDVEDFANRQDQRSIKETMNGMINTVSGSGLKGRGLGGAGVAPLEGVVRRGRTYNLNEIQGLATPSSYICRQLGSSIDNKTLFKEILAITHLQYNFHDRLEDPLESLRAEYDKLKGELELGNDNPSIIKQLKSASVDMYSNS